MKKSPPSEADLDRLETWIRYRKGLCGSCRAVCCTMPVEVRASDLVRMGLADAYEVEDAVKQVARRLQKEGVVERFNLRSGIFTLARRANGDCIYLDAGTRLCTIYAQRPDTCRNHPAVGPRPGFCAYQSRS